MPDNAGTSKIVSDDEYINGQSVIPVEDTIAIGEENVSPVQVTVDEGKSIPETTIDAQAISPDIQGKVLEEESVSVTEIVDYVHRLTPQQLEMVVKAMGVKIDPYTDPIKRTLQEIGLVSCTGELPSFLKDKVSAEFEVNNSLKLSLRKVLLDENIADGKSFSFAIMDSGEIYLLGKVKYIVKKPLSEFSVDGKVIGIAFESGYKGDGHGFGVYNENGNDILYTDGLNVYNILLAGDLTGTSFYGKSIVGNAILSENAYLKGYFILSNDSKIVNGTDEITLSELTNTISSHSSNIANVTTTVDGINNTITQIDQSIQGLTSDVNDIQQSVSNIISDGIITSKEKRQLRQLWSKAVSDKDSAKFYGELYSIGNELNTMLNAFYDLANYLNNNTPYSSGYPYIIDNAHIDEDSAIDFDVMNAKFNAFWNSMTSLLNACTTKVNESANNIYSFAQSVQSYAQSVNDELNSAKDVMNQISSDGYVTPAEKREISKYIAEVQADKVNDDSLADSYGISRVNYDGAVDAMLTYLIGIVNDVNDITHITIMEYNQYVSDYIEQRRLLYNSVNVATKTITDDISDIQAELVVKNSLIKLQATEVMSNVYRYTSDGIISLDELPLLKQLRNNHITEYDEIETHYEVLGLTNSPEFTNYNSVYGTLDSMLSSVISFIETNQQSYVFGSSGHYTKQEFIDNYSNYYDKRTIAFGQIPFSVEQNISNLSQSISDAVNDASTALSMVTQIANDNIVSPSEKQLLYREWLVINNEKPIYTDYANSNGITPTNYSNAYIALGTFLNNGIWNVQYVPNLLSNLSNETDISSWTYSTYSGGEALRQVFKDYYLEKVALLNTIEGTYIQSIKDISDDSIITPSEKVKLRVEWNRIVSEYNELKTYLTGKGLSYTNYDNSFKALAKYLNNDVDWVSGYPNWINDTNKDSNTSIDRTVFDSMFSTYYYQAEIIKTSTINGAFDSSISNISTIATDAQNNANTAIANANNALSQLTDIASDSKFTPNEKVYVRKEWEAIASEKILNDSQADLFGITTEKTTYGTNFQNLANYLNNGTTWSSGIPVWINDSNLNTTTTIDGPTFRTKFKEYYDARTALLNAIAAKAKTLADNAQSTANSAQTAATNAQNTANTALTNANNALTQLTNIASDNILSPIEKQAVKREWDDIVNEKQKILDQAYPYYDVSTTAYTNAYDALNTYITPLLSNLNTDSTIDGPTFRSKFNTYYLERQNLLNAIAEQSRRVAKNGGNFLDWQQLQLCNYPITSAAYTNFATGIYGDAAENAIVLAETPFGTMDKVWESNTAAADAGSGGGISTTRYVRVDPNKSYIFYAWVKILDAGNVTVYYGLTPTSNKVINLNTGSMSINPYFMAAAYNYKLPQNRWLLLTGIVHSKDYAGSGIGLSGIYDPLTKKRLSFRANYAEFKWYDANVNSISVRVIRTDSNTINSKIQIYGVGIYEMNGQEPSVYSLLSAAKVSTIPVKPSDANLKAFYTFDKNMLFDDSGNGKGLTKYGTRVISQVASDIKGKCLFFDINDTNNGYLYIDDSAYFKIPELTISLWFKFTGFASGQTICGLFSMPYTPRVHIIYSTPTNYARAIVTRTSDSANLFSYAYQIETNRWYHLTFVQKTGASGYSKLYINGNIIDVVLDDIKFGSGTRFMIGTDGNNDVGYRFNGYIDELRFYNKALTDEEIAWLYLNPTQGLDYGSLKTIIDGGLVSSGTIQVGQGNDGDYTVKAGITGEGSADSSVRIWAGNTFTGRSIAPFRVQQDGTMYASKGFVGVWEILDNVLQSVVSGKKMIIDPVNQRIVIDDNGTIKVKIVSSNLPALSTLLNPQTATYYFNYQRTNTSGIPGYFTNYYSFAPDKVLNCKYRFWYSYENLVAQDIICRFTLSIYLCNTDNSRIRLLGSATRNIYNSFASSYIDIDLGYINNGSYKLEFYLYVDEESYIIEEYDGLKYQIEAPGELIVGNNGSNQTYITGTQTETGNIIGTDGVAFFAGAAKYFYLNFSTDEFLQILGKVRISNGGSGLLFDSNMMKNLKYWRGSVYNIVTVGSSTQITNLDYEFHIFTGATSNPSPVNMPKRTHVKNTFGFSDTDKFAIRMVITYVGSSNSIKVYGRNTVYSNQNTSDFPYMWDNNGSYTLTDGTTVAKGDVLELLLCYDGTTFFAVRLNYRT